MSMMDIGDIDATSWQEAGRMMLTKAMAELSYEELLASVALGDGRYRIDITDGISYELTARRGALGGGQLGDWQLENLQRGGAHLVRSCPEGRRPASDPLRFIADAASALGIACETAGHLVRELTATLAADARRIAAPAVSAAELAELDYAELEQHQDGHPWLLPNKGRIGFSTTDVDRYAPESGRCHRLPWIAVHRRLAEYRCVDGLEYPALLEAELDSETRARFTRVLEDEGPHP